MVCNRGGTSKRDKPGRKTNERQGDAPEPDERPREMPSTDSGDEPRLTAGFGACEDDLDAEAFDPNAGDFLGDFGLDDEEAVPEAEDFWFDDADRFDD